LGARAYSLKPKTTGAYKHFLIRADLQNRVTPISRYCRVGVQAWSVRADGTANLADAFALAATFGEWLESQSGSSIILNAEIDSGPMRVKDDIQNLEYAYVTLLLEVTV
jgi:hypothetical protein